MNSKITQYLAAGFPVFPCHGVTDTLRCTCGKYPCGEGNKTAGKHPYTLHGCKDASNDTVAVEKLFNYRKDLNVAIVTGKPSGVFVVDIDCEDSLADYALPLTLTTTTGRGRHLYFNMPDFEVKNSVDILPKVDIRGSGGYIIAQPSRHYSGVFYTSNNAAIADAPDWLLTMLKPKPRHNFEPVIYTGSHGGKYALEALKNAEKQVANAPEGRRNDILNKEMWSLMRFVGDGNLYIQDIANTLAAAALSAGLNSAEIKATLKSALMARGTV